MKITVCHDIDIELSEEQQKKVCISYVREKFGFNCKTFIDDGFVYEKKGFHTSHYWESIETVRKATPQDYVVEAFLKTLLIQ